MKNFKNKLFTIFLILLPLIIFFVFFWGYGSSLVNIDQKKFEHIVLQGDAKKITLITNQNVVEISLNDEALHKKEYLDDFSHINFINKFEPQYILKIPSAEIFNINFRDLQSRMPKDKKIYYDSAEHLNISDNLWNCFYKYQIILYNVLVFSLNLDLVIEEFLELDNLMRKFLTKIIM